MLRWQQVSRVPVHFGRRTAGEQLAAILNSHARCWADVLTSFFTALAEISCSANLGLSGSHEILGRHVRFSVHRVEREFLSRRFEFVPSRTAVNARCV